MTWKMSSSTVKMSSSTHLMSGYSPAEVVTALVGIVLRGLLSISATLSGKIKA